MKGSVVKLSKRIKLSLRILPDYTRAEENTNMITHIVGGALGIIALILCTKKAAAAGGVLQILGAVIFGVSMILLYTTSSIYHGLRTNMSKKVMQVLDHCMIYFLIAGTYTPILLSAFLPVYPTIAWGLLALEWGLGLIAITLTAIDLKKYTVFSMICYIFMGWAIIFFIPQAMNTLTPAGFYWILGGGIAYTIGAVLYGLGSKLRWMHSVFHIFVVLGSLLQFAAILFYVL